MPSCCPQARVVNPFDPFARIQRAKDKIANKLANASTNKAIDLSQEQGADEEHKDSPE
jgi:hypothetical protein